MQRQGGLCTTAVNFPRYYWGFQAGGNARPELWLDAMYA